ncbi:MAG: nucleotidyltransferase family protein [Oscillospiraceae bacterium]|nr:nucleotidyltransferase family protein [Oscillospiraceae bacterium]
MPLKGSVLKDLYPIYGMRQMSDNDILIDSFREAEVKKVMEDLGFEAVSYGKGNHDVYHKQPVSNIEIHTSLFVPSHNKAIYEYYRSVEEKLMPKEGFERKFSDEDFYIYMIAHEYKHYTNSGTGIRSLLDVYVFLRKHEDDLDKNYIDSELKKLGLEIFENDNRDLNSIYLTETS